MMKKAGACWVFGGIAFIWIFGACGAMAQVEISEQDVADEPAAIEEVVEEPALESLSPEELRSRLAEIDTELREGTAELHQFRITLREDRNQARLTDERVVEINAEINRLRQQIEGVLDEIPEIKVQLDSIAKQERAMLKLMQERKRVAHLLTAPTLLESAEPLDHYEAPHEPPM